MKSCKSILPAGALMIAALFTYAPDAAAQAKEGTWKSTLLGRGHTQGRWVGNWLLFVYDENGTTDGDGIFDHTTWHCWGRGDFLNEVGFTHGGCIGIDPTRDMAVLNFLSDKHPLDQKIIKGWFKFTAGTGKYAGITGTGSYTNDGAMLKTSEQGTYVSHNTIEGNYKLPSN